MWLFMHGLYTIIIDFMMRKNMELFKLKVLGVYSVRTQGFIRLKAVIEGIMRWAARTAVAVSARCSGSNVNYEQEGYATTPDAAVHAPGL
jgi:hypothetical protein